MPLTPALHRQPCHRHHESASDPGCRWCAELLALRLFRCALCGKVALICHGCDRGQIYCADGCANRARRESLHRAGARYRQTRKGRRKHAAGQARYRREQKKKVTHQSNKVDSPLVKPCLATEITPLVSKEPDGPKAAVFSPPLVGVALPATLPPEASTEARPNGPKGLICSPAGEYVCDFCGRARSRYIRREPLVRIRRRLRGRPPGPPA